VFHKDDGDDGKLPSIGIHMGESLKNFPMTESSER
jgi:hypothetical protein